MARKVALGLLLVVALAASLPAIEATCCKRKSDFGCCGNGPCNIFCCNCDNGCNTACDDTSCSGDQWATCGGIVMACAAECASIQEPACFACMDALHDKCKGCYSSRRRSLQEVPGDAGGCAAITSKRDPFFEEVRNITGVPPPNGIGYMQFETYTKQVAKAEASTGMGGPATMLMNGGLPAIRAEFHSMDSDGDGYIDRYEFGY